MLRAQAYADSALIRGDPGLDGLYWSAAVKGRLALQYGIRTTARLAQEVWDLSLSGWQRTLGRWVLGTAPLREASWERALEHHRQAAAGDSTPILFHMDLGRTPQLSGDPEAARVQDEEVLALPESYPVDPGFKRLVRRYLAELPPAGG